MGYMAPEQVRGKPVDLRADLFNLGLVLYEMVSGKRAFHGASSAETGYAILFKEPAPLPSSAPRAVRDLIARCLQKDRDKRPATAREALAFLESRPRWSGKFSPALPRKGTLAAIAAAAVILAAIYPGRLFRSRRAAFSGAPPSGTVAILPFGVRDAPRYAYLSEGLVDLLARDLQGSGLRAVDSASVLRALGGDPTAELDRVRGASARLGAKYFVLGRIEERRGELLLEAVLHTGDAGEPVTQTLVQGDPPELLSMVRKLSDNLQMRPLPPKEFDARLAGLARRTSRSPVALQAWLEGERLLRRGNYEEEVVNAFQRAVVADTEFALAHYRLGVVAYIIEPGLSEDALQRALRYSARLNPAERSLVEARLAVQQGRLPEAERILLNSTQRSPDDAETWMQLGEVYFHQNPLRARSPQESVSAFEHVLTLDPLHVEAVSHLADLAQMRGERSLVARLSDRLLAISNDPTKAVSYRLARAWSRGDAAEREQVLDGLRGARTQLLKTAFVRTEWQMDSFADAQAVAMLLTGSEDRPLRSYLLGTTSLLRGKPEAARAEMARGAELSDGSDAAYFGPWMDTLDFVPASAVQLAAARAAVQRIDATRNRAMGPAKLHLAGALAVRAGDFAAAEAATRQLESAEMGSSIRADLALAVRARVLAARNDPAGALALLAKQQLIIPARYAPWFPRLSEHWLRAGLLERLGRQREALALYDAISFYNVIDPVFVPVAHLRKAKLLDALGEPEAAAEHYQRFAEIWSDCEPAGRPELARARARVLQIHASPSGRSPR
jgi:tetratricopeptide (TPR) repeat protein